MKKTLLLLATLAMATYAQAKVTLPSIISDNMVLQQSSEAALWGWAEPGKTVKISTDWSKRKYSAKADDNGKWMVRVSTPSAGGPYSITFNDGEKTTINDVLIGEVWYCSGQSNMEIPMRGYNHQPIEGAAKVIATAQASRPIRICTVEKKMAETEQEKCNGSWHQNVPGIVAQTSATAYFFADFLQQALDVPVGILISDWGGTRIEAWMDKESLSAEEFASIGEMDGYNRKSALFNGQVAPLIPFTFKGMIWYQGCTNIEHPKPYERLQPAFVKMMRERFQNPDAPFYFVQLAPWPYGNPNGFRLGYMCEAQERTLKAIPNSGMARTLDIGAYNTIHPSKKQPVGQRLALMALQDTYGRGGINSHVPTFKGIRIENGKIIVSFDTYGNNLAPMQTDLAGFEVAGADRVFHPATGYLVENVNEVAVSCPEVTEPVAVRYCFRNWSEASLFDNFGSPVGPFRSDNWDDLWK